MLGRTLARRQFLRACAAFAGAAGLAACQPKVVEKIVKETVVVEKPVEKVVERVVKETVIVAGTPQVVERIVKETVAPPKPVELRLQNWWGEADMWAWQIGLDKVKAMYPNINIKSEFNAYAETAVKIMASAAAGTMPDLIMASNEHTPILACKELLKDLNPFIDRDPGVKPDDFAAGVSQGFKMWGRWWGFPYDHSTYAIYYNRDLFEKAGVPLPPSEGKKPWSWQAFAETAQKLTNAAAGKWGVSGALDAASGAPGQYMASCFIYSGGGRNFSDDLRTCTIDSEGSAKGLQFLLDLIYKYKVSPTPQEVAGSKIDMFASQISAMEINGQWAVHSKNAQCNFGWDVAYLPISGVKRGVTGGSGFCISPTTKYPEDAWKWLKEFTSGPVLGVMVGRTGRGIPARWSATPEYLKVVTRAKYVSVFVESLEWAFNDRSILAYYEFIDAWKNGLAPIYASGKGDFRAALAEIQKLTNAALKDKWSGCTLKIS